MGARVISHLRFASLVILSVMLAAPVMGCPAVWGVYTEITGGDITAPQDEMTCCPGAEVACSITEATDQDSRYYDGEWTYPYDTLTYTWTATDGDFSGGNVGRSVTWVAPSTATGQVTITCTISDAAEIPQGETGNRNDEPNPQRSVTVSVVERMPIVDDFGELAPCIYELYAQWTPDPEDDIVIASEYAVGTQPGSNDVRDWTDNGMSQIIDCTGLDLQNGSYYFSVHYKVEACPDCWGSVGTSDGITVSDGAIGSQGGDPMFQGITVDPSSAKCDDVVTITFTASKDLWSSPTCTVNGNPATFVSKNGRAYTYHYTVDPEDGMGWATVAVAWCTPSCVLGPVVATAALYIEECDASPPGPIIYNVLACDDQTIAVYWSAMKTATGYEVFRSTVSGSYGNPVDVTPTVSPADAGIYCCVDDDSGEGLTAGQEYFYVVKAVYPNGISPPSNEESDVPDSGAIPWCSRSAGSITSSFLANWGCGPVDQVRVLGPDGEIYDSFYGTLPPDGTFTDERTFVLRGGDEVTLPWEEPGDEGVEQVPPTRVDETDGPVRRVRSTGIYRGVRGNFAALSDSSVHREHAGDCFYQYLGCRNGGYDIDAGLAYTSRVSGGGWVPWLSLDGDPQPLANAQWRVRNTSRYAAMDPAHPQRFIAGQSLHVMWTLNQIGNTRNANGQLYIAGLNEDLEPIEVLWGAPLRFRTAMMKRAHTIAQGILRQNGRATGVWPTGSYMRYAAWSSGQLIRPSSAWEGWANDEQHTHDQGTYPAVGDPPSGGSWVWWSTDPPGYQPWSSEQGIFIRATQSYP